MWSHEGTKRLAKCLTFSSQQVHDAHCSDFSQPETAVRVTGFTESVLEAILTAGIAASTDPLLTNYESDSAAGASVADRKRRRRWRKPGQITAKHLQIGIHLNEDLYTMCDCNPSSVG